MSCHTGRPDISRRPFPSTPLFDHRVLAMKTSRALVGRAVVGRAVVGRAVVDRPAGMVKANKAVDIAVGIPEVVLVVRLE